MQIAQNPFGVIAPPQGVTEYNAQAGGDSGLLVFISNAVQVFTVIAGLYVLINIILAGYTYLTSNGDPAAHGKVSNKITQSVLGLVIIIAAYMIMGLLGLVFFNEATFFLQPIIKGPGT